MTSTVSRRWLLGSSAAALAAIGAVLGSRRFQATAGEVVPAAAAGPVTIELFDDAGKSLGKSTVAKIVKAEEEWQAQLASAPMSNLAFEVTRHEGTEQAFTGPNWDNHSAGLYRCICCDNALFLNDTKFDSGTGWPSFWQPIAKENVIEIVDKGFGMVRTAVACAQCDAHLGHVFNDGPPPTGLRYCMNGVAMRFIPQPAA